MNPIKVSAGCKAAKKMPTSRTKRGDIEILTCSVGLGAIRVQREYAEELAGLPIDSFRNLYDDKGYPRQRTHLSFPKRELVADFSLEHRRDSGAAVSSLKVTLAAITGLQVALDAPDDMGECAVLQFVPVWKSHGDEVEDVEAILGRPCHIDITFKDPPQQEKLFADSKPSAKKEAAAAQRNKLDQKSKAAGEKPEKTPEVEPPDELADTALRYLVILESVSITELQGHLKVGYNRAARICEAFERDGLLGSVGADGRRPVLTEGIEKRLREILDEASIANAQTMVEKLNTKKPAAAEPVVGKNFEREARDRAARNPRRDPKPKTGDKRGDSRGKRR